MVNCGPVAPCTCPNDAACWHDIGQHRYEPNRDRWVCTVDDCHENPYCVVTVSDSNWSLNAEGYGHRMASLRALHGPDVTFEFVEDPPAERRKRLGLHWWQRGGS